MGILEYLWFLFQILAIQILNYVSFNNSISKNINLNRFFMSLCIINKHSHRWAKSNEELFCDKCDGIPVDGTTRHCKNCNFCVWKFDHHCYWLNKCIGGHNYSLFYKTLVNICLIISIVTAQNIAIAFLGPFNVKYLLFLK